MSRKSRSKATTTTTKFDALDIRKAGGNIFHNRMDPLHQHTNPFANPLSSQIWRDKYAWADEDGPYTTFARVCEGIYQHDTFGHALEAFDCMHAGLWMPGGRIIAGAGTSKRVTLMNCYVNKKLEDSLDDIMQGVSIAALTQQQGGGIGTDFSTLRPEGAILQRTGARASGPLPFMDMWDSMCSTIMSAGDRRGAMMATITDTHPDLPKFITAKSRKGRLTNFNVSVLVSDALIEAVKENEDWLLYFPVEPASRSPELIDLDFEDEQDVKQFVYASLPARSLWELITKNTYEFSEPGVIFIDRINDGNNLYYCEQISCTNPCGEQPLPPNGTCNLGAINLSRMVHRPFTDKATFDFDLLKDVTRIGVRFLDNVIDVTNYPLTEQRDEEFAKRRLGLGVSGLADAIAQMGMRYGSAASVTFTEHVMEQVCQEAYRTSVKLAKERGAFPLFKKEYLNGAFIRTKVDYATQEQITADGIRNGVLLTVAPTGTTSILYGNVSSGIEPVFDHYAKRRIRQADNSFKQYDTEGYLATIWDGQHRGEPLPSHCVTMKDLQLEDHLMIQAAVQRWVDASVSKTINLPKDITYEAFTKVYDLAYSLGCKGCTTYRPSDIRGSILTAGEGEATTLAKGDTPIARPEQLRGLTHKIRWPSLSAALYLTVNYTDDGRPFEIFLASKDARYHDWMTATSLMVTALLRKGGNPAFIAQELQQVRSIHDQAFAKGPLDEKPKNYGSLIAYIGAILEVYLTRTGSADSAAALLVSAPIKSGFEICPSCLHGKLQFKEGCKVCDECNFTSCG